MDERKSHYSPAQFGSFLKVQLVAGRQRTPGRFRSLAALKGAVPAPYLRFIDFLLVEGDLVVADDGSVYVDGWEEWQEGDLTVSERMARLRNRKRNSVVTGSVSNDVTLPSPTANASANALSRNGEGYGEGFDGRADLEAFLLVRHRPPTPRQRELMDNYIRVFDVTGPSRAERIILGHPDDPIGALKADLDAFRAERSAAAAVAEAPKPRRAPGLTGANAELARLLAEKEGAA
jgi:hypothetical protein